MNYPCNIIRESAITYHSKVKNTVEYFHIRKPNDNWAAEKQRLKEKIVTLNYYRMAKAETCFIKCSANVR